MTALATQPSAPKDWRERRKRRHILTSASQYETFELCPRKWWLSKVRKLKEPKKSSQSFGTVLHGVIERYLSADELGRDPKTGLPVDLYPQGWEVAMDKFEGGIEGVVPPIEQDLIKKLVAKAIEEGVLSRTPWRMVERPFRRSLVQLPCPTCDGQGTICKVHQRPVRLLCDAAMGGEGQHAHCGCAIPDEIKCPTCGGDGKGTHVEIQGYIDFLDAEGVHDHKSVKTMRYALSVKKLEQNTQILIYAHEWLQLFRENGWKVPAIVKLRHNQYCKDPENPVVRKTEAEVTAKEIDSTWTRIIEHSKRMAHLRDTTEHWSQIPDPVKGADACNAYGGCPFQTICGGRESEVGYEQRLARHAAAEYTSATQPLTVYGQVPSHSAFAKGSGMSFDSKLAEKRAATGAAMQPGQVNPPPPPGGFQPGPPASYQPPQAPQGYAQPQAPQYPQQPQQPQYPPQGYQQPAQPHYPQPAPAQAPAPAPQYPQPAQAPQPAMQMPPPPPMQQPPMQQPMQMPPQQPAQQQPTSPPWADPGCQACGGWGFNTMGNPCRICDHAAQQTGRMNSANFVVSNQGNGTAFWKSRDGQISGFSPLPSAAAPAVVETRAPAPQPPPAEARQPSFNPGNNGGPPAPAQEEPEDNTPGKAGRPAKSFIFATNIRVTRGAEARGDRKVFHLHLVLAEAAATYAKAVSQQQGREMAFTDLDPFQRRDALVKMAPEIVKDFKNAIVVCDGIGNGQSDLKALADAIRPYAGMEMCGTI